MKILLTSTLIFLSSFAHAKLDKEVRYTLGHLSTQSLAIRSYSSAGGSKAYGLILFQNERPRFLKTISSEDFEQISSRIHQIFPKAFLDKPRMVAYNCHDSLIIESGKKYNRICLSDLSKETQKDFTTWWQTTKAKAQK